MSDEEVKNVIEAYYNVLGIVPSKRRHSHQVKARAAIMVALRSDLSLTRIGRMFGMDHASVLHHAKKHDSNMKTWKGYAHYFDVANTIVQSATKRLSDQAKLAGVKAQIEYLEKMKEILINQITA